MSDSMRYNHDDDDGRSGRASAARRARGFTLVELIVVMVIIGIILALMLAASRSALRTAQEKATQSLIAKLDSALSDRVDAILQSRVSQPSVPDVLIAQIYDGVTPIYYDPMWNNTPPPSSIPLGSERAYVIAQTELYQREMPDVFYIQSYQTGTPVNYPLNFAANPYPIADGSPNPVASAPSADAQFVLPLGTGWPFSTITGSNYYNAGLGIYGASYHVAAGVYKNLGYYPTGCDGVDNNGNGLVDEWAEGVDASNSALVVGRLANHKHKTARAEVLYALLVDSTGPFGSIFTADDFTEKEVQDTDGDGLPEFVDAWGEPLQFYRWPLLFHSDLQRGQRFVSGASGLSQFNAPYDGMIEQREVDPLDPNQQLMAPAWWSGAFNDGSSSAPPFPSNFGAGAGGWSPGASAFENYFHPLHEPLFASGTSPSPGQFWDRGAPSGAYGARRAFSSKFLVLSSGPDAALGVFQYDDASLLSDIASAAGSNPYGAAFPLLGMESLAAQLAYDDLTALVSPAGGATLYNPVSFNSLQIQTQGQDDVSNHYIPAGGIGGSAP